jgi:hypothetical protein
MKKYRTIIVPFAFLSAVTAWINVYVSQQQTRAGGRGFVPGTEFGIACFRPNAWAVMVIRNHRMRRRRPFAKCRPSASMMR